MASKYDYRDELLSTSPPGRWAVVGEDRSGGEYRFPTQPEARTFGPGLEAQAQQSRQSAHDLALRLRRNGSRVWVVREVWLGGRYEQHGFAEDPSREVAGVKG